MIDVVVYLVHWNAPTWCAESVTSILGSEDVLVHVGVVNNGGELTLPDIVEIVDAERNLGFAGGANVGLSRALETSAQYVLIGCHDVRLTPRSLRAMIDMMSADEGLGIVGPTLNGLGGTETGLDWISGTALMIRREVVEQVRFDERWGSYVEDVDYCYRARDLGWRIGRAGDAHATMYGSVDSELATHLMHSNTLVFFVRRRLWRHAAARTLLLIRERRARTLARAVRRLVAFPFESAVRQHQGSLG